MISSGGKEVRDMMTIKAFAQLCGCHTQTLRYYDKIDLLKPQKVDPWSGYRYYAREQAVDFIKIKNLQAADFSIEEIKNLLDCSDQQIYQAFQEKIAAQEQKLAQIKKIQQSYLSEKSSMERIINSLSNFLTSHLSNFELLREFGLTPEDGPAVVAKIKDYIEEQTRQDLAKTTNVQLVVEDQVFHGADRVAEALESLTEKNLHDTILLGDETQEEEDHQDPEYFESVWECHGWNYVYEFLDQIPQLEQGREYYMMCQLNSEKDRGHLEFPLFLISIVLSRANIGHVMLGCNVTNSPDEQNHFALMRRK